MDISYEYLFGYILQDPSTNYRRALVDIPTTSFTMIWSGTGIDKRNFDGAMRATIRSGSSTNKALFTACDPYRRREARASARSTVVMTRKEDCWHAAPVPAHHTLSVQICHLYCTTRSICYLGGFVKATLLGMHSYIARDVRYSHSVN